jgi:hypothetical protein
MRLRLILPLMALLTPVCAGAQSIGEPIPGRRDPLQRPLPKPAEQKAARPCPEYGPGFVRIEGGTACVRLGGSVAVEYGVRSGGRSGSAATGAVRLEARDQTGFGEVRTVIQGRGRLDRGLYGDRNGFGYR